MCVWVLHAYESMSGTYPVTHADLWMNKLYYKWTGVVETKKPARFKVPESKGDGQEDTQ